MDEFFKMLVATAREAIDVTFELARAKTDLAKARETGDAVKVYAAETALLFTEAKYYAKTAALTEKQLEHSTRMLGEME